MSDHFACISVISEKRRQRKNYLAFVIRKLDKFKARAEREGSLDDEDIKRANEAVNEAKEEIKKHKTAISKELDNLKRIIHGQHGKEPEGRHWESFSAPKSPSMGSILRTIFEGRIHSAKDTSRGRKQGICLPGATAPNN